jgi:hypothetical protein
MKSIFKLYGEFDPKWMRRRGFWRLLWFALVAKFGYITTNKDVDGYCLSIGTSVPLNSLWQAGYIVHRVGEVLGETVLFYRPNLQCKTTYNRYIMMRN